MRWTTVTAEVTAMTPRAMDSSAPPPVRSTADGGSDGGLVGRIPPRNPQPLANSGYGLMMP